MRKRFQVMLTEDDDEELNALSVCVKLLLKFNFDAQWRIVNYLVVRLWSRSWSLVKPKGEL